MLHYSMPCLMQIAEPSVYELHEHDALHLHVGMAAAIISQPMTEPMMQPNVPRKWALHASCELECTSSFRHGI